MSNRLAGKVAIVTGASKGIGAGIAKALAAEGASVVVNYSTSKEGADRVVAAITSAGGKAVAVQGDVSKQADITRLFAETNQAFGKLDVLVNNSGIYEMQPLEQITEESFHRQFNTNVLGVLLASKEALKYFPSHGGSIINTSSVVSTLAPPDSSIYSSTKGAVDTITRVLANELGARNIRVNAINPGMIETEGVHSAGFMNSEWPAMIASTTPLGRIGQVDDIAPTAVYLASDDSKYMTGETLFVSGGKR
jgi:3-oxoacyl-[acyl-carrier protein] reductase